METNESDFDVVDFKSKINLLKNDIKSLMESEADSSKDNDRKSNTTEHEKLKGVKVKNGINKHEKSNGMKPKTQDNVEGTIAHDDQIRKYLNDLVNKQQKKKRGQIQSYT